MKQFAHFDGTTADRDVLRWHLAGKAWIGEWVRHRRPTQPGDGHTTPTEPGATCAAIRAACGLHRAYLFSTRHKMNDGDEQQWGSAARAGGGRRRVFQAVPDRRRRGCGGPSRVGVVPERSASERGRALLAVQRRVSEGRWVESGARLPESAVRLTVPRQARGRLLALEAAGEQAKTVRSSTSALRMNSVPDHPRIPMFRVADDRAGTECASTPIPTGDTQ